MTNLLSVKNLNISFQTEEGLVSAVHDVSLSVSRGKTHGIVGESGSGKSVTCQAVMGLSPENANIDVEALSFNGVDLLHVDQRTRNSHRGRDIAMIFQDPLSALNPVHSIGAQIREALELHRDMQGKAAKIEAMALLDTVGIPDPKKRLKEFPHQLSGGMCQRIMIAMALACQPSLLIADEPTTALDVTVQAQILDLLKRLQSETGMAIILITHDIGVIAEMAEDVSVMYQGEVVESGCTRQVLKAPAHEYTQRLLAQVPRIDRPAPVYRPPTSQAVQ